MQNNRAVGSTYERIAGNYLEERGYTILKYNYHCRMGEIDIIAKNRSEIIFVEVKYRKNLKMGNPLEAVNYKKQQAISKCASYYLLGKGLHNSSVRFDVIGIIGDEIQQIENAFEYVR